METGDVLRRELRAWDTEATVVRRLSGGARSEVWLVELQGVAWTARRRRRTEAALDWELDLIEHLAANGIGVPRVLQTADGRRSRGGLVVLSWIDGRAPDSRAEWRMVGEDLRRVHALTVGWVQRPTFASTQELLSASGGGDVDLRAMPAEAVERCRDVWRGLAGEDTSAIHGDPRGNVLITKDGVAFIDWDEARVDASILDLVDLPFSAEFVDQERLAMGRRAASAWEAANAWILEPEYARRRLNELS